jgi:hypothetical protein
LAFQKYGGSIKKLAIPRERWGDREIRGRGEKLIPNQDFGLRNLKLKASGRMGQGA